jgi:XRE family transcriptional regulator, fatty acid utilization regulator
MPDGRAYLWIARTVTRHAGGFHDPGKTFAIGLGCDIRHASRLVYADDLDLDSPSALTPIGPGCKLCDRPACPQRAFPAIGKPVDTSTQHARFAPYSTS